MSAGDLATEVVLTGSTTSPWKCDTDWYNDGQYCDCNCGVYDPDCGLPSKSSGGMGAGTNGADKEGHPLYVLLRFQLYLT